MHSVALVTLLTLLQATPAPPAALVEEVGKLAAASDNDARFDALTSLLRAHNLAFTIEPFTIDKAIGAEPRTRGRNIVVSIGDGAEEIVVGAHYDAVRLADGSLSRGAVDDGAACVMLLHVAETLRAESLPVRVKIVWFDMEELGLVGSATASGFPAFRTATIGRSGRRRCRRCLWRSFRQQKCTSSGC